LTTDSGIDLVAYSGKKKVAVTIQVKTNLIAKPGGGKGKLALDWWAPDESPADLFAFVDLEKNRVWFVKTSELPKLAQQNPEGKFHLYMYTDHTTQTKRKDGKMSHDYEFTQFLLENTVHKFF
jgi:hypothetical protein